jgi:hypothetical protein
MRCPYLSMRNWVRRMWWPVRVFFTPTRLRHYTHCGYGASYLTSCGNQKNGSCRREWYSCAASWHTEVLKLTIMSTMAEALRKGSGTRHGAP